MCFIVLNVEMAAGEDDVVALTGLYAAHHDISLIEVFSGSLIPSDGFQKTFSVDASAAKNAQSYLFQLPVFSLASSLLAE